MKKYIPIIYGLFLVAFSFSALSADEHGCWSGRYSAGSCLEYSTYTKDRKTYFKLKNLCDQRLYMRWCAGSKCGSGSLRGGQTKKQYEYITGAYNKVKATGSNIPSNDWVCTGKVAGWHD